MLEALITELASIEDPRCEWKVEHRLLDILVIAVCAVLGEAESFEDIALYGRCKRPWPSSNASKKGRSGAPGAKAWAANQAFTSACAFFRLPLSASR